MDPIPGSVQTTTVGNSEDGLSSREHGPSIWTGGQGFGHIDKQETVTTQLYRQHPKNKLETLATVILYLVSLGAMGREEEKETR